MKDLDLIGSFTMQLFMEPILAFDENIFAKIWLCFCMHGPISQ